MPSSSSQTTSTISSINEGTSQVDNNVYLKIYKDTTTNLPDKFKTENLKCNMGWKLSGTGTTTTSNVPTEQLSKLSQLGTKSFTDYRTFNTWSTKPNNEPKCWMTTNTDNTFTIDPNSYTDDRCFATIPLDNFNALAGQNNGYNKQIVFKCTANTDGTYSGSFVNK